MSANPLSILPHHAADNLAPLKPLLKLGEGEKNASTSLDDAVRERFSYYLKQEEATWNEYIRAGEEVANFIAGKQFLMPSPYQSGPRFIAYAPPNNPSSVERRALSHMQYHTTGNLEKWLNSNPDVRVRPGIESDDAYEAADAASVVVDHYESKFYGSRVSIAECLEGLTFGSYIWRLRIDPSLKSLTAYRQIFENREVKIGAGWGKCGECGNEGTEADFTHVPDEGIYTCPKCHSEALVIPAAIDAVPTLANTEPVELGDFRLDLQSFAQCRWDLKYHADESPWMIIQRRTSMAALKAIIGNVRIPEGGANSSLGLDVVDRLAYSGQARAGQGGSASKKSLYKDPVTIDEWWASPDEYGDIILKQDVETVSGQCIVKDIPLGEQLGGKNACLLGINSMAAVLGIFIEDHRDYIVQGKWYAKTGTGAGRGLQDLTEVQKVFNSDHQQIHTYLRSVATPAMAVVAEVLGEEDKGRYIGQPNTNLPIPLSMFAEGVKMNELAAPVFQPGNVSGQFLQFTYDRLAEYAQFASHFMPFTGGLPGVDNKTATGANITQAATNALYTPVLSVKGEVRRLISEKLVKLYPRHFPVERDFPLGGKYQRHAGKFLKVNGTALDTALLFDVVADSWNPRNVYIKRQDYAAFGQIASALAGIPDYLTADRIGDLERTFDLEEPSETRNVAHSLCFRRVRQIQQSAGMITDAVQLIGVQPVVDPATGQVSGLSITGQGVIQPPVSSAEPGHSIKREWLMDWLDSDDGLKAPMHVRAAVELLIQLHTQLETVQGKILAQQQGEIQVAQAEPQMAAQQQAAAAQGQQQLAQEAEAMKLQGVQAAGQMAVDEANLETEAERESIKNAALAEKLALRQGDREHQAVMEVQ